MHPRINFLPVCQTFSEKYEKYRFEELSSIACQNIFCLEKIISGRQRPGIQDVVRVFRTHLAKRMHRGLHQGTCGPMVLCGVLPLARRVPE